MTSMGAGGRVLFKSHPGLYEHFRNNIFCLQSKCDSFCECVIKSQQFRGPVPPSLALKHDKLQMEKQTNKKNKSVQSLYGALAIMLHFCVCYIHLIFSTALMNLIEAERLPYRSAHFHDSCLFNSASSPHCSPRL